MTNINIEPVGKVYLSPAQKKERHIRHLRRWVILLGLVDAAYTFLFVFIFFYGGIK